MLVMKNMMPTLAVVAAFACGAAELGAQEEKPDPRVRTYVYPTRIVAASAAVKHDDGWPARCDAVKMDLLLARKHGQVSEGYFGTSTGTRLVNRGDSAYVILDFGRELQGGVQLGISKDTTPLSRLRLRFGESVAETCAEIGEKHAANEHSLRDVTLQVPLFGSLTFGETGFRFLRIDLVSGGEAGLEFVRAVSAMRPMKPIGGFRSSDARLNRVYETAVRTVHLCCQDYLWDAIKRDRLVWMGDSYPMVHTILPVFGAAPVVPETLDFAIATTPTDRWMVMAPYTLWWIRCLADWYRFTGDQAYLARHADYLRKTLAHLKTAALTPDHRWKAGDFLDWPTKHNAKATAAGVAALAALAFDDAAELLAALGDTAGATDWRAEAAAFRNVPTHHHGEKSAAAMLSLADMIEPKTAYDEVLSRNGVRNISTFMGYFVLEAMSKAGASQRALETARDYWGGMLDMGATSYWENFDVSWTNNCFRIDELPVPGKRDIHGDFGEFCYPGFRHSLCHGWGCGPAAWCIGRILGIRSLDVGCHTVEVKPFLGDLAWAEGAMALPDGRAVKVRAERRADGSLDVRVDAPDGVRIVR